MKDVIASMANLLSPSRWRGYRAGLQLLLDPNRLEKVFELDAALPDQAAVLARVVAAVRVHPDAAIALAERPRLTIDVPALRTLPDGTFGRAVARYFDDNGLDPKAIPKLESTDEIAWTKAHLYETHDLWHVATGFATDMPGELALQAFGAAQLPGRLTQLLLAGGLMEAALWKPDDFRARLAAIARGWDAGTKARPLFGVRWDRLWNDSLDAVRAKLALS
jgi:ubiquinone biosynthesis protein COQ4